MLYLYKNKKAMSLTRGLVFFWSVIFLFVVSFSTVEAITEKSSETKEDATVKSQTVKKDAEAAEGSLKIDAKSAVLLDADSGTVIYEQNSHEQLPPASVTKIMTMLLSLEAVDRGQISINDKVTISERAASMGGSQMYMETGESQSVENLLKGMAICSANDA